MTKTFYFTNPGKTVNFKIYEDGLAAKNEANGLPSDSRVRLRLRNDNSFDLVFKEPRQVEVKEAQS